MARKSTVDTSRSAAELVRSGCAESLAAIEQYHARAARFQAEPIHQMRIGTRRLRAILHLFADITDAQWAAGLESELRWLAYLLGNVRDLDVLRERLRDAVEDENAEVKAALRSIDPVLAARHRDAKAALRDGLQSERYDALMNRLREGQRAPQVTLEAGGPVLEVLLPRLNRAWKKLARSADKLRERDAAAEFHRVRKMGKRIRYAAELMSGDFHPKDRKNALRFIDRMKTLQDTLGQLQDAEVAAKTVELLLEGKTVAPNGLHEIIQTEQRIEEKARRKFPKVWQPARDIGNKKWMSGLSKNASKTI